MPVQAASKACVLGTPRRVRLYLVWPPVPASQGSDVFVKRSKRAMRVEFTAATPRKEDLEQMALAFF